MWELKCVNKLTHEHVLQLALYAWLHHHEKGKTPSKLYLFNIRSGELLELHADIRVLNTIVTRLVMEKMCKSNIISDDVFVNTTLESVVKPSVRKHVSDVDVASEASSSYVVSNTEPRVVQRRIDTIFVKQGAKM